MVFYGRDKMMLLTLREKRRQWIRLIFRTVVLAINTTGLFLCLYLENVLMIVTENQETAALFNNVLVGNRLLLEEFNAVVKTAWTLILVLTIGLCIMIYCLVAHEIQVRAHIHQLLHCVGYRPLQVFAYEFIYELWDLFFGFAISTVWFVIFRTWIMKMKNVEEIVQKLHWNISRELMIFAGVFLILNILDILCCLSYMYKSRKKGILF